ncbi:MAG: polysaccharide biosynthesis tyrosine autokinase [Candidatus Aenigmarchaeota archaeon]|nr:polysaccharide biosynthesis tyrosine autokinase [Candidatus Aenigmarchaeota archaeon]
MSRVYEALKKLQEERERGISRGRASTEPQPKSAQKQPKGQEKTELVEPILPERVDYGAVDERLITLTDPQSVCSEQFRKIRTVLSQLHKARNFNTFMITSALRQEGKTITSCNLGTAITQGYDDQAFLIDCDMRKPGVHLLFGFDGRPGLAEFLAGNKKLSQIIHEIDGLKLKIIPAGRDPESPGELLSSEKMANLLRTLKAKYQDHYILLDTTPVLLTAEPALLSSMVDGIILVIMAGKTPRDLLKRVTKEIPREKVIGIVFNNVHSKEKRYSRYYSTYYHRQTS